MSARPMYPQVKTICYALGKVHDFQVLSARAILANSGASSFQDEEFKTFQDLIVHVNNAKQSAKKALTPASMALLATDHEGMPPKAHMYMKAVEQLMADEDDKVGVLCAVFAGKLHKEITGKVSSLKALFDVNFAEYAYKEKANRDLDKIQTKVVCY